jgi:hypothetical protein
MSSWNYSRIVAVSVASKGHDMSARRRPPSPLCHAATASHGCPQHPWAAGRPWARSASHATQCCPAPVAIVGSLQRIETAPRGEVLYCIYLGQEVVYQKQGLTRRPALRTRPLLLLGSWRQDLDPKPRWQDLFALKFDFYLILGLYGLIPCWILFGDSLCASNTSLIWYLVSHGELTCHGWRKIETNSSCDRWSGGTSLDPMCKRKTLERDLPWFRASCGSEITWVGLGLDIKKELRVHMRQKGNIRERFALI